MLKHLSNTHLITWSAAILALAACSGGDGTTPPIPVATVATVTVTPQSSNVVEGQTVQLNAVTKDASGNVLTGRSISWTVSGGTSATVSTAGLVTTAEAGTVTATATSEGQSGAAQISVAPVPLGAAVPLIAGTTVGKDQFPAGDTPQGGQGQAVGPMTCLGDTIAFHLHVHVALFVNGTQMAIPLGIGVLNRTVTNGFVTGGSCYYWTHTHDATGIIHVEAPVQTTITLGQLFDVWGQPLTTGNIAGFTGPVTVYVDGKRYSGDPRTIQFAQHQQIVLEVGTTVTTLPNYTFPGNY